jgi:hypothetical protein
MAVHEINQRYVGNGVRLAWAVVDDELVPVSKYVGVPPRQRPRATCPVCLDRVWFNLGTRKAHHFSHARGADCAVQSGETAAHLNTKFQIAAALREASQLRIRERCCGRGGTLDCSDTNVSTFASSWDDVQVERGIGALRPDIVLMRGGAALAAVEVFATHQVPAEKAAALAALGLPWIEVKADQSLYNPENPWTAGTPLPALRREPASDWRCEWCSHEMEERERFRREEERRAAYHARLRRKFAMVVDVYRPGGRHFREVIWTITEVDGGRVISALLWKERLDAVMGEVSVRHGDLAAARRILGRKLRRWVDYHERNGAIVDPVTGWVGAKVLRSVSVLDLAGPRRYEHDPIRGWEPVKAPRLVTNLMDLLPPTRWHQSESNAGQ